VNNRDGMGDFGQSLRSRLYRAARDLGNVQAAPWRPNVLRQAGGAPEGLPDNQWDQ
jgi:hypothetical protein